MKKVIFVALATVFMLSSGFTNKVATETKKFETYTCNFSLTVDGENAATGETFSTILYFSVELDDNVSCVSSALWHQQMVSFFSNNRF